MRAAFVAVVLLAGALAGCAGPAEPDVAQDEGPDGGPRTSQRTSRPGDERDPPHTTALMLDVPLRLVSAGEATFEVEVPANTTNVDAHFAWTTPAYQEDQLALELEGCGAYAGGGISAFWGGGGSWTERVCKGASPGKHAFTVRNGPAGFMDGTLRLTGQQPLANGTAPAS